MANSLGGHWLSSYIATPPQRRWTWQCRSFNEELPEDHVTILVAWLYMVEGLAQD